VHLSLSLFLWSSYFIYSSQILNDASKKPTFKPNENEELWSAVYRHRTAVKDGVLDRRKNMYGRSRAQKRSRTEDKEETSSRTFHSPSLSSNGHANDQKRESKKRRSLPA